MPKRIYTLCILLLLHIHIAVLQEIKGILNKHNTNNVILPNGILDGPFANLIGVHGNKNFDVNYEPKSYIELLKTSFSQIPSLYNFQLQKS